MTAGPNDYTEPDSLRAATRRLLKHLDNTVEILEDNGYTEVPPEVRKDCAAALKLAESLETANYSWELLRDFEGSFSYFRDRVSGGVAVSSSANVVPHRAYLSGSPLFLNFDRTCVNIRLPHAKDKQGKGFMVLASDVHGHATRLEVSALEAMWLASEFDFVIYLSVHDGNDECFFSVKRANKGGPIEQVKGDPNAEVVKA